MNLTKHTNYPCKQCIAEGKATDFVMTSFDKRKLYKKTMYDIEVGQIIRKVIYGQL